MPAAKRAKLDASVFTGLKRVSFASARAVLEALPEHFRDGYTSVNFRQDWRKAQEQLELDVDLRLIIQLPLKNGDVYEWTIARPTGVLRFLAKDSPALKRALACLSNSPDNPSDIVHYLDEVTPGHLLAPVHNRKFTAFRYSFKQFGKYLLTRQQMWFEYAFLRATILEQVHGGTSYAMRVLMHTFFIDDANFMTSGAQVNLDSGPTLIFAKNGNIIADTNAR